MEETEIFPRSRGRKSTTATTGLARISHSVVEEIDRPQGLDMHEERRITGDPRAKVD
jgi:hypothetical protein